MRLLSSWDRPGTNSSYTALSVGNVFGVHYYILFSCGNIVQIGKPGPPPPPARPVPPPPAPKPKPTPTPTPTPIPHPKDVCPLIPGIQTQKSQCLPCLQSKNDTDVNSCLLPYKRAKNVTQNISAANRTTAHAGDTITYVLYLQNRGRVAAKTIVVENMTDVLEYANITNLHGGTISQNDNVSWPQQVIPAKTTISHEITVQVKSPIPQTPSPCPPKNLVSHCPQSGSFDLIMTNTYGNTINIHLPRSITKTTEKVTTTTLPNTGPGTSIAVGFGLTAIVGYFFARSRLLTQELDIIRKEYTVSGGM